MSKAIIWPCGAEVRKSDTICLNRTENAACTPALLVLQRDLLLGRESTCIGGLYHTTSYLLNHKRRIQSRRYTFPACPLVGAGARVRRVQWCWCIYLFARKRPALFKR